MIVTAVNIRADRLLSLVASHAWECPERAYVAISSSRIMRPKRSKKKPSLIAA